MFENAQEGARTMVRIAERYEPDPETTSKYDEMFTIYKDAYNTLVAAAIFEKIVAL